MQRINPLIVGVAIAALVVGAPRFAVAQAPPPHSPLAQYPGFGHDHHADRARFQRQELARERSVARCMQRAGFQYTPAPSVINPPARDAREAREALVERQHPNQRYVASLSGADRTSYYLALSGVPDPNDEQGLWDPRSPTGGGCSGEAMREFPSVYAAKSWLREPYRAMLHSVSQDARVQNAEREWAECMRDHGHDHASPRAMYADLERLALQRRLSAEERQRDEHARTVSRECRSSTGLDEVIATVRVEKEAEFVRAHRDVLERHLAIQRIQNLPPD